MRTKQPPSLSDNSINFFTPSDTWQQIHDWNTTRNLLTQNTRGEISKFHQLVRCQYVEGNINCCGEEIGPNFCLKSDKTK